MSGARAAKKTLDEYRTHTLLMKLAQALGSVSAARDTIGRPDSDWGQRLRQAPEGPCVRVTAESNARAKHAKAIAAHSLERNLKKAQRVLAALERRHRTIDEIGDEYGVSS